VGVAALLDGLQSFGITARLPVRHARQLYSLAAGSSWASLDVAADASQYFVNDPVNTYYSTVIASSSSAPSSGTARRRLASDALTTLLPQVRASAVMHARLGMCTP
jgi:hypothetical protein